MSDEEHNINVQLKKKLPGQIERFYNTYFFELREGLARSDLFVEAVPEFLRGYKRVLTMAGTDGIVAAHFPIEFKISVSGKDTGEPRLEFPSEPNAIRDAYEFVPPLPPSPRGSLRKR